MSNNKRVVLIGYSGAGKTSLYNLITQSDLQTGNGGMKVTLNAVVGYSEYLKGFEIIDTPGFLREETLENISGILAALFLGSINRIFLVIKHSKTEEMFSFIKELYRSISKCKDIITIVVTHWDLCNNREEEKEMLESNVKKYFQIESFIYCSNQEDKRQEQNNCIYICTIIKQILDSSDKCLTYTATKSILEKINIPEYIDQNKLEQAGTEIEQQFKKLTSYYKEFIDNQDNDDSDVLDKMHFIQIDIKQKAEECIKKFQVEYGEQIDSNYDLYQKNKEYILYITLQQHITEEYQKIIAESQKRLKQLNIQYYQWIKRCPKCNLVWTRTEGCGGSTNCGLRPVRADADIKEYLFKKYDFIIVNEKLNCIQTQQQIEQYDAYQVIFKFFIDIELEPLLCKNINLLTQNQVIQVVKQQLEQFQQKPKQFRQKYQQLYSEMKQSGNWFCNFSEFRKLNEQIYDYFLIFNISDDDINVDRYISEQPPEKIKNIKFLNCTVEQWLESMTRENQKEYLRIIKQSFLNEKQEKRIKQVGCNALFNWGDQPPISQQELSALLSPDLFDYMIIQHIKFEQDDDDIQRRRITQYLNFAITEQLRNIQYSPLIT